MSPLWIPGCHSRPSYEQLLAPYRANAIEGVDYVLHTASPFLLTSTDENKLVKPAVNGTLNVLRACALDKSKVRPQLVAQTGQAKPSGAALTVVARPPAGAPGQARGPHQQLRGRGIRPKGPAQDPHVYRSGLVEPRQRGHVLEVEDTRGAGRLGFHGQKYRTQIRAQHYQSFRCVWALPHRARHQCGLCRADHDRQDAIDTRRQHGDGGRGRRRQSSHLRHDLPGGKRTLHHLSGGRKLWTLG